MTFEAMGEIWKKLVKQNNSFLSDVTRYAQCEELKNEELCKGCKEMSRNFGRVRQLGCLSGAFRLALLV